MVSLGEKIKRYNRTNNENFIIPGTELRFITHQEPSEDLEIRLCERNSYNDYNHCRSCSNWIIFEQRGDGRMVEIDGHLSPSGICPHCGGCSNCRNVRERIQNGQSSVFDLRDNGWHAGFSVTERIVISHNQLSFSNEMKREIEAFFNRYPGKDEGLSVPKGLNFMGKHDDNLNIYEGEWDTGLRKWRNKTKIRDNFWLILNKNCWDYFTKDSANEPGEIMAGDGTGMIYLRDLDQDFLVKRSTNEVLRFIGENSEENNSNQFTPPQTPNQNNANNDQTSIDEIVNYNIMLIQLRSELVDKNDEIIYQGTEKLAILMSLQKDGETGVEENLVIINDENQPTLNLQEKFEDPASHADNQQREIQNEIQINNYKNWLARKEEAVKKLEAIINQVNQEKPTNETPGPTQKSPDFEKDKNENPIVENNKNSNENIEELSHLSLTEAKNKAKEEINNLLERYGVKPSELDTKIWEETKSWEKYLESLSDNEKIEKFVKKIKVFIIQQNNKNKQKLSKLSLEEMKQECKNQINELLQKYSDVNPESLDKKLWGNEESWEKYLEKLTDKNELLNFTQKMREVIIYRKLNQLNNKNKEGLSDKKKIPLSLILIPIFVLLPIFLLGGLMIIRKRKKMRKIR